MAKAMDDIRAAVTHITSVVESAKAAFKAIAQKIAAAAADGDDAALEQLAAQLDQEADGLAADVVANTPAASPAPPANAA